MAEERSVGLPARISRADLILTCMPLLFVGGYGAGVSLFDSWSAAAVSASIVCCLLMVDGLFRNPPVER